MAGRIIETKSIVEAHDEIHMRKALDLARRAFEEDEVPIGAVIVSSEGTVIGAGSNKSEQLWSQSRHAEVIAIEEAGRHEKDWRLVDCTLYVTVQPCLMCMSLVALSRISRVVYGAESPLFGYHLDFEQLPRLYRKHIRGISSGVLQQEAQQLIETFFKEKRIP